MTPGIKKSFHNDKRINSPGGYRIIHIYPPNESFKTVLTRNDKIERGNRQDYNYSQRFHHLID